VHRIDVGELLLEENPDTDVLYRSEPCVSYQDAYRTRAPIKTHLGGALAYSPLTDELYVSIGDLHLGSSTIGQAESIGIENVETDYAILTDPTAAVSAVVAIATPTDTPEARIFSKGLRNSLGMTVTASNDIWLSDHGPSGGDELNLLSEGSDYGWPLTSSGQPYDRSSYPDDSAALPAPWLDIYLADIPGTTPPAYSWTPAVAPTAVVEYPNTGLAPWQGTLVMSSLRAQSIIVLSRDADDIVEQDRFGLGERIRDMVVTESGDLVMVTDSRELVVVSG
jgi:Glucose/sorbosone dehydrogenases